MALSEHSYGTGSRLNVFSSVDNLPLRSASALPIRRIRNPYESLERILNKTTLSTQRVTHSNIIKVGGRMLEQTTDTHQEDFDKAIQEAVDKAEERATRELRAALKRLGREKDEERQRALQKQKEYAERHAERVSEQRDRAEKERIKDLRNEMIKEREEALERQRKLAEEIKQKAVADACKALTRKLQREAANQKEEAVAEALRLAEIKFQEREKQTILATRQKCEEEAEERLKVQALKHEEHIEFMTKRYNLLQEKLNRELALKAKLEKDFHGLQSDYRRFLDYTDGHFHSDYLMKLRHVGLNRIKPVCYEDLEELK